MSTDVDNKYQYNNMDFDSLFNEMIDFFKNDPDSPIRDLDYEGSNVRNLIKILAYATNLSLFHTSVALNEMYFSTSRLRKNLVKMLPPYSYTPRRNESSSKYLTISNTNDTSKTIPEFTAFTATGNKTLEDKVFYTLNSYLIPENGTEIIKVYQAETGQETTNFDLVIENEVVSPIILELEDLSENYFKVQTIEDGETIDWVQYEDLDSLQNSLTVEELTLLPEDNIYFLDEIDNGYKLSFSETGIGATPNPDDGQTLTIFYMLCDGATSNGFSTSNFEFFTDIDGLSILSDSDLLGANTTSVSSAGRDKETLAELKENTIDYFNTQNRAVTEYDYTKLGKQQALIGSSGDIKVYGGEKYSTGARLGNVYIIAKPASEGQYFFTSTELAELLEYFLKYRITGITPIVQNPHYINAIVEYNYIFKSLTKNTATTTTTLNNVIKDFYISNFGETIYIPALIEALNSNTNIESAFVKDNYKILFDTLSTLTGTYKLIPMLETEIVDFINSDGSFFSDNVYGSTSASNYGDVIFVNEEESYIVVNQGNGITNTNFAEFQKGTAYIDTRKDITSIVYDEISNENYIYISGTDGFTAGGYISSLTSGNSVSATIQSIEKSVTNKKYVNLQLDSVTGISVGDILVNAAGVEGTVIEIVSTLYSESVWISYTNGSDFADGTDLDITTYSAPGAFNIVRRVTLSLDEADLSAIVVGDTMEGAVGSVIGTVTSIDDTADTIDIYYSDTTDFINTESLQQAGSDTNVYTIAAAGVGTISNGIGTIAHKAYLRNVSAAGFTEGAIVEPGDSWGYNVIAGVADSTHITVTTNVYGLSIGDTICESGGTNTTVITDITALVLEVTSSTGFTTGETIHKGSSYSALISETLVNLDPVYDTVIDKIVVSNNTDLTVGKYLVSATGIGEIDTGGISGTTIDLVNIVGTFSVGTDNVHQVDADTDSYEPLYTLNGNIEDFSTEYVLEVDTESSLPLFINKLDATDTGMLDASTSALICGYSYLFNTVSDLDRESVVLKLAYGTGAIAEMETEQNTIYEIILELDSTISAAVGDYVTASTGGVATSTGYVYEVDTSGGEYHITVRYNTGTWAISTSNNIEIGSSYSSPTKKIIGLGTITSPEIVNYVESISGDNTDFIASVNLSTGNVAFRRASVVVDEEMTTVDYVAKTITCTDTSDFLAAGTIYVWDTTNLEWLTWDYTTNVANVLTGVDSINENIIDGLTMIQDKTNAVRRSEFHFTNKIDKLSLGNRSLFYSSLDLIKEFN